MLDSLCVFGFLGFAKKKNIIINKNIFPKSYQIISAQNGLKSPEVRQTRRSAVQNPFFFPLFHRPSELLAG